MYLRYEQVAMTGDIKSVDDLDHIPSNATHATLQAEGENCRYTMDLIVSPNANKGMLLLTTQPPREFLIEDVRRIQFVSDNAAGGGSLNLHYFGGRDV